MLVPWAALNGRHPDTAQCTKEAERERHKLVAEEVRAIKERDFQAYVQPLNLVTSFKYLGRILTASDDDWPVVVGNLRKVRKKWVWLSRILGWAGDKLQLSEILFRAVVQSVLLFESGTLLTTPRMGRSLGGFQHRADRHITGR